MGEIKNDLGWNYSEHVLKPKIEGDKFYWEVWEDGQFTGKTEEITPDKLNYQFPVQMEDSSQWNKATLQERYDLLRTWVSNGLSG